MTYQSTIDSARTHARNVKRWRTGDMGLRWAAAGMLASEGQCHRVQGQRQLDRVTAAIRPRSDVAPSSPRRARLGELTVTPLRIMTIEAHPRIHGEPDSLRSLRPRLSLRHHLDGEIVRPLARARPEGERD
ncbi:MAG: hypothetical protein M0Z69_10055, partial [Actinomycetota bacterium]|nr:hypothetical protein [Actinomycetota bacterium]